LRFLLPVSIIAVATFVTYYVYILYVVDLVLVSVLVITRKWKFVLASIVGCIVISIFAGQLYQLLPSNTITSTIADFGLRSSTYAFRAKDLTLDYGVSIFVSTSTLVFH